jgi:murein DD-endopeptidase MepM/ murein hydrolase activator NlpD
MSEQQQRRARTTAAVLLAPVLLVGSILGAVVLGVGATPPACAAEGPAVAVNVDVGSVPEGPIAGYGGEQLVNAAYIMQAAKALNLTVRDQQIGVMTAMGESSLRVVDHGDAAGPDSRGLFQQRSNGAWGSYADRMDPFISATNFFKAMVDVEGRESLEPTIVAHRTQHNADPYHYRPYWDPARQVVAALAGVRGSSSSATATRSRPSASPGRRYNLGPVRPQTTALANTLGPMFGIETIGGYRVDRESSDHPDGLALDFMVYRDRATGQQLAEYAQQHADDLGIQYIIWYQRIWNIDRPDEGWRGMEDRGSPTANHIDHVHISLRADASPVGGDAGVAGCPTGTSGAAPVSGDGWTAPAAGPVTDGYGWRIHPITGARRFHYGTDIGAPCDATIRAANAGIVVGVTHPAGYGTLIEVDHGGGVITSYAHMYDSGVLVRVGDDVAAGHQIAKVGSAGLSTACHLHFEVKVNDEHVDPEAYLGGVGVRLG